MKELYQILHNRAILFISFLAMCPLLVKNKIKSAYYKGEIKYIYEYPQTSIYLDYLFGLIIILLTFKLYYRFKNGIIIDNARIALISIITFWYAVVRFQLNWKFSPSNFSDSIFYTDILFVIFYHDIIIYIKNIFELQTRRMISNSSAHRIINKEGFDLETLDDNGVKDILGRKNYAKTIANSIIKSKIGLQESCAIGITGSWGSGKSFFLNEIKKCLNSDDCQIIEFNPWKNHANSNIINNFFDTLNDSLAEYNPKLTNQFRQYANQLANAEDNSYVKILDFIFQFLYGKKSIDELYNEINRTIKEIDRKIIVFIDDLDRLNGAEVVEVVKLIRTSSNFQNTFFVVAYDKGYISNVLASQLSSNNDNFLEKIFIAEFCLPDFEPELFYKELENRLIESVDEKYHPLIRDYFTNQPLYNTYILKKCIVSIRDIYRFPNVFKINFKHISEQVWFFDFLNLELIKYKYPSVYTFISKNLIEFRQKSKTFLYEIDEEVAQKLWDKDSSVAGYDISILCALFKPHQYNNKIPNHPLQLLSDKSLNENTSLSIRCYSNCFTYFTLRLLNRALDETEFQNYRRADTEIFLQKIEEWSQMGDDTFVSLKVKIFAISNPNSALEYKNLMRSLYYLIEKSYNSDIGNPDEYTLNHFHSLLINYKSSIFYNLNNFCEFIMPRTKFTPLVSMDIVNKIFKNKTFPINSEIFDNLERIFLESAKISFESTVVNNYLNDYPFGKTLKLLEENAIISDHSQNFCRELVLLPQNFIADNKEVFLNTILNYKDDGRLSYLDTKLIYRVFLDDSKIKNFFLSFEEPLGRVLWGLYLKYEDSEELIKKHAVFGQDAIEQLRVISSYGIS